MVFAGIDVSQAHLDLALLGPHLKRNPRFPNTKEGRKSLPGRPPPAPPGLDRPGAQQRLPSAPRHPSGPKRLPGGPGQPLPGRLLPQGSRGTQQERPKRYARVYQEHLKPYTLRELKELVGYREDLAKRAQAIRNQLEAAAWAGSGRVIPFLQRELAHVRALVEEVEAQIQALLGQILEAAASYAGLIPEKEESGKTAERTRLSRKGPPILLVFPWGEVARCSTIHP